MFGGADGIRTHDLLDAIEARSQLRHGPTVNFFQFTTIAYDRTEHKLPLVSSPAARISGYRTAALRYVTAVLK